MAPTPVAPSPSPVTCPSSRPSSSASMPPSSSSTRWSPILRPASMPTAISTSATPSPRSKACRRAQRRRHRRRPPPHQVRRRQPALPRCRQHRHHRRRPLRPPPRPRSRRPRAAHPGRRQRQSRPSPASLAFRLEDVPGTTVARVVWDGESPWTATQLLQAQTDAADDGDARRSVIDEARAWLRETLAAGPRPARELRREASERGIGRSALYAARKAEGITIAKEHDRPGQLDLDAHQNRRCRR